MTPSDREILERGREVLATEAGGLRSVAERLDDAFVAAVRCLESCRNRVVVTGVGKSGLVARKVASTLASTGTPAVFLHPVEGAHGDLGMLVRGDTLLAVSRSGESEEIVRLLPAVKRLGVPVLAVTGDRSSTLGLGDALAMALLALRGFGPDDFARLHPAGVLGRRLLWRVRDVMVDDPADVPWLAPDATLAHAMREIAHRRGTVPILDAGRRVVGVMTAGDLTRFAESRPDFLDCPVRDAMTTEPRLVDSESLAVEAVRIMEEHGVMALPVVDEERHLLGIVHLHDLLRAGVA
jgi:arabinose-5-phosphate isomerase